MAEPLRGVVDYLKAIASKQELRSLSDADLLRIFVETGHSDAFAALLRRHGPMVMGLAHRIVRDQQIAEDVFQAAFLVLSRKASSIRRRQSLSAWLHSVALRLATRAKKSRKRNKEEPLGAARSSLPDPLDELSAREFLAILDEELARLPEKYRVPLILCHLEGLSQEEAAKRLGVNPGSVKGMLERGRGMLRDRLAKRGLPAHASLPLAIGVGAETIGTTLVQTTLQAAMTHQGASAAAVALAEGAIMLMTIKKISGFFVAAALLFSIAVGGGLAAHQAFLTGSQPTSTASRGDQEPQAGEKIPQQQPAKLNEGQPLLDLHGDPLPVGAVARMGQDRWLHDIIARYAAFTPDGKGVVTIDYLAIRVWEFPSGKELRQIPLPDRIAPPMEMQRPFGLDGALNKDGRTFAVNFYDELLLFDISTGKQMPAPKMSNVFLLDFSPGGSHLAITTKGGTVRVWDWIKAKEICSFASGQGTRSCYAPDGKSMATIYLLSPDSSKKSSKPQGVVKIWDCLSGREIRSLSIGEVTGIGEVGGFPTPLEGLYSLAYSPDGELLAVCISQAIVLLDPLSGKEIRRLILPVRPNGSDKGPRVVFGKDGAKLYLTSYEGKVMEWDVATGKLLREVARTFGPAQRMSLSPDGKTLIQSGHGPPFLDISGKEIRQLDLWAAPVVSIQFNRDGKSVLTQGMGSALTHSLRSWDVVTGKELGKIQMANIASRKPVATDGKLLAAVFQDANQPLKSAKELLIEFVDMASGMRVGRIPLKLAGIGLWQVPMAFSPDRERLAVGDPKEGSIAFYQVPSGKLLHSFKVRTPGRDDPLEMVLFSPDGSTLACYADRQSLGLWNTWTGQRTGSLPLPPAREGMEYGLMKSAQFSPDGRCLALDIGDGTVAIYELPTGKLRRRFGKEQPPPQFSPGISMRDRALRNGSCFAFSPDGKYLSHVNSDNMIRVWDVITGRELCAFKGHNGAVSGIAYSPDGSKLATASTDSTALIWDVSKFTRSPAANAQGSISAKTLQPAALEECWEALAENDAAKVWAKMCDLIAAHKQAVPLIKERVEPAIPVDLKRVEELIQQLDSNNHKVREGASAELSNVGGRIVPALEKALAANPPLETKQRLDNLRAKLTGMILHGDRLRAFRAIEVLELIGTPEAWQVLRSLAGGAPAALPTTSAQAALMRLAK